MVASSPARSLRLVSTWKWGPEASRASCHALGGRVEARASCRAASPAAVRWLSWSAKGTMRRAPGWLSDRSVSGGTTNERLCTIERAHSSRSRVWPVSSPASSIWWLKCSRISSAFSSVCASCSSRSSASSHKQADSTLSGNSAAKSCHGDSGSSTRSSRERASRMSQSKVSRSSPTIIAYSRGTETNTPPAGTSVFTTIPRKPLTSPK
mmetsp:Transcript_20072/g.43933  ORF Transcript_20072/g.43933 Transcript_20072/m.43933 type:complete len:209 (+) Transcript_20072:17-643(+)